MIKLTYKEIRELKSKYENNVTLHLNKCSIVKECPNCGKWYVPTHHKQKFCDKNCFKEHRRDYKARWKRENYKEKPKLGTGYISETRNKDFEKEHQILQRELRRLKR